MSRDTTPFVPPIRYPSPPQNMWFEVPKEPPGAWTDGPRRIFPWEDKQPKPARSFISRLSHERPEPSPELEPEDDGHLSSLMVPPRNNSLSDPEHEPSDARAGNNVPEFDAGTPSAGPDSPWTSFSRNNAWDEIPEIGRYVEGLQRHHHARSRAVAAVRSTLPGPPMGRPEGLRMPRALRVTDFPTGAERPSLPVTPAPIKRPSRWGGDGNNVGGNAEAQVFPAAQGVPAQSEWVCVHGRRWGLADCRCLMNLADALHPPKDPAVQLQKLAEQQSEALLRKLGGGPVVPGARTEYQTPSTPSTPPLLLDSVPRQASPGIVVGSQAMNHGPNCLPDQQVAPEAELAESTLTS